MNQNAEKILTLVVVVHVMMVNLRGQALQNMHAKAVPYCIIHCTYEDTTANFIYPKDMASWQTLLKAADIRNHVPLLRIAKTA